MAVPLLTAFTKPSLLTVATESLLVDHITFLFVASVGKTVAIKVSLPPTSNERVFLFKVTLVTGLFTVTTHVSFLVESNCEVTVIVAVPALSAVTLPVLSTLATEPLLVDQVTFLFVALDGKTVAISVSFAPISKVKVFLFSVTLDTGITGGVTVTLIVALHLDLRLRSL